MTQFATRTAIVLGVCAVAATHADATDRPNLLFLFADDWGRHASAYAQIDDTDSISGLVGTPHFDRLATEGVLFTHAFVSAPSCTPCRSALLSGQHFWRTRRGAILRGATWDPTIPTFPLLLERHGYHLGFSYKVWSPGTPRDAPIGGERTEFVPAGRRFNSFSQTASRLVARGVPFSAAQAELLAEVRGNFRAFLAARGTGQPFAFWLGPTNVHRKWEPGSGQALWGLDPAALRGKLPPFLPDVPEVCQDLTDYLGEVQAFDLAIGVLVEELRRLGEYERTLIVISGDHGPPGFPHGKCNLYDFGTRVPLVVSGPGVRGGRVVDDLVSLPDLAPTILESAKVEVPAGMTARTLWPVLGASHQGQVDPTRTEVFTGRERHVAEARAGNLPYPQRAIRTLQHLLILNFHPERYPLGDPRRLDGDNPPSRDELTSDTRAALADEDAGPTKAWLIEHRRDSQWAEYFERAYGKRPGVELYDVHEDPHQMRNLAADPTHRATLENLQTRLLAELQTTGDPRLVDNGRFFEEVAKFDTQR
jgi:uncharacterized sulfatase